ncbi:stage III sporulation protein AG [Clostridium sp. ZS2-4]|uniref:stage III sporulation protein AG n=1 Tax=Clostridium sp. ZS2-4 TaxID=2987703 RepID=UPI00227B6013|nr:stage III sporulation protein AG [Clostridium sp. ZS2-4]MCY6354073.1 stage III sporulation protein AG [Clostridium sp. ZS2-4]
MSIKKIFDVNKISDKVKNNKSKSITNLIILALIGILLAMLSNVFKSTTASTDVLNPNNMKNGKAIAEQKKDDESVTNEEYRDGQKEMELKLKDILENIKGVGKVKVMIYFKGGEEQVPALNINDSTSHTEEKDVEGGTRNITQNNDGRTVVMMNTENGSEPLILKKYNPEITGVCVVAEGAEDNLIKLQIQKAVINLFGLKENKVNVYPMKK